MSRFTDEEGNVKKSGRAEEFAGKPVEVDNRKVNEKTLKKELKKV